jgi:hypothetical protein
LGALYRQPFDRQKPSASPALSAAPSSGLVRGGSAEDDAQFLDKLDAFHEPKERRATSLDATASSKLAAAALPGVSFARTGASFVLNDPRDPFTKLSVSFAFAQSARLSVLENQLEELVETIRPIPEAMAQVCLPYLRKTLVLFLLASVFFYLSIISLCTKHTCFSFTRTAT